MELVNRGVRQFATAFNTLLSVTYHVAAPSSDAFGIFLFGFDICTCADQLREQFLVSHHISVVDLCCLLSTSKMYLMSE